MRNVLLASSDIVLREVSSAFLNDSDEQLVIFRKSCGMGSRTAEIPYRIV